MAMANTTIESMDPKELFECPVCLQTPEGKIFLCQNGHPICGSCIKILKTCGECRVPFGPNPVRNLPLEVILDKAIFPCTFKDAGCLQKIKRIELPLHKIVCSFRPVNICGIFGFNNCKALSSTGEELRKHLDEDHKVKAAQARPDNTYSWVLKNFQSKPYGNNAKRIYNGSENEQFAVVVSTNHDSKGNDVLFVWTVLYLGNMYQAELQSRKHYNVTTHLSIWQDNQKIHLRTSREALVHFKAAENRSFISYTRISFDCIKSHLDPNKGSDFDFELELKLPPNVGDIESRSKSYRDSDGKRVRSPDITEVTHTQSRPQQDTTGFSGNKKIKRK